MGALQLQSSKTAFLFPGQGSFTDTLLHDIVQQFPQLGRRVEIANSIVRKLMGKEIANVVYNGEQQGTIDPIENDFEISQCVIYLSGYFLYEILREHGVNPDVMVGHSVGEIPALAAAGAMSFEDGLRAICHRTLAIQQAAREGKMYALNCEAGQLRGLLKFMGEQDLQIAVINGKKQTVVSGSSESLSRMNKIVEAAGFISTKLKSQYPFHSTLMLKSVPLFYNSLREIKFQAPSVPVYSPILGRFYQAGDDLQELLPMQLMNPVNFHDSLYDLYHNGCRRFVEAGGKNSLSSLARSVLADHTGFSAFECQSKATTIKENILIIAGRANTSSPSTAPMAAAMTVAPPTTPKSSAASAQVQQRVLEIFKELTNYPEEILELDADLEGDLGLDSVKQIEIVSALLKEFSIPPQQNLEMARYNTIRKTTAFVNEQLGGSANATPAATAATVATMGIPTPGPHETPALRALAPQPSLDNAKTQARVLSIFKELTNYPEEILELDADLEGDLGLDSVKQIEIVSALLKEFSIPPQQNLEMARYNTIRKTIAFVEEQLNGIRGVAVSTPEVPVAAQAPRAAAPIAVLPNAQTQQRVLAIFKELTNYPEEILELDADLEGDLGLDSVKQIEIVSALLKEFSIPPQQNLEMARYNTIRKTIAFVDEQLSSVIARAS